MTKIENGVRFEDGPTILLNSGHYFDLGNPEGSTFAPHDLILGMARECRFAGQCEPRYCVAEHSAHLGRLILHRYGPQLAWDAVWHDSPEGIIKDIPRPEKILLPDYKALEARIEPVVLGRLGVTYPLDPLIKKYDMAAQLCEKAQIEPHRSHWPRDRDPEKLFEVWGLSEEEAVDYFYFVAQEIASRLGKVINLRRHLAPGDRLL